MSQILVGDCIESMKGLPAQSVHCCVTSPPYWGLRDYGVDGQLGLESTPAQYVEKMVDVFREVKRVLRDDGTLWLNLGDSYASDTKGTGGASDKQDSNVGSRYSIRHLNHGVKQKDLCGIPWSVAFALRADGWYLRSDIIWSKPNPMPESVTDRPTKAHEYIFLLSKSRTYFYDAEAIKEDSIHAGRVVNYDGTQKNCSAGDGINDRRTLISRPIEVAASRNRRSVWTITTQPYPEAHFATYPEDLVEPCIKAGTSEKGCCSECGAPWERQVEKTIHPNGTGRTHIAGHEALPSQNGWEGVPRAQVESRTIGWQPTCDHDQDDTKLKPCTVLDPFGGSGTTGLVARKLGRDYILCELNPKYADLARKRIGGYAPLFGVPA
jgi:DNA modification methylase